MGFYRFCQKKNIPIGPGRGSAAGSLIAYALGITQLDPLKYNLILKDFKSRENIYARYRYRYLSRKTSRGNRLCYRKYGADKVAQIITFGTMKARAAIRDVGRVLNTPLSKIDAVAKLVPFNATIKQTLEGVEEFRKQYLEDREIQKL